MCRTLRLLCNPDLPLLHFVAQCRRYVLTDLIIGVLYLYYAYLQRAYPSLSSLALITGLLYLADAGMLGYVINRWQTTRPTIWYLNTLLNAVTLAANALYYGVELKSGHVQELMLIVYVLILLYKAAKVFVMHTLARRVIAEGPQVGAGYSGIQGAPAIPVAVAHSTV